MSAIKFEVLLEVAPRASRLTVMASLRYFTAQKRYHISSQICSLPFCPAFIWKIFALSLSLFVAFVMTAPLHLFWLITINHYSVWIFPSSALTRKRKWKWKLQMQTVIGKFISKSESVSKILTEDYFLGYICSCRIYLHRREKFPNIFSQVFAQRLRATWIRISQKILGSFHFFFFFKYNYFHSSHFKIISFCMWRNGYAKNPATYNAIFWSSPQPVYFIISSYIQNHWRFAKGQDLSV